MPRFNPGLDHLQREPTAQELNSWFSWVNDYKHNEMLRYQSEYNLNIFVETGTSGGESVVAMSPHFKEIFSFELDKGYYDRLISRSWGNNVHLFYGDSAVLLPELMGNIPHENILFWLDAHAGNPFRVANPPQNYRELIGVGKYDFSGLIEMEYLLGLDLHNCVIMADDIECGGDGCLHGGCGCEYELMRIAPNAELEMSIARVVIP
jgi:hypothetical protein